MDMERVVNKIVPVLLFIAVIAAIAGVIFEQQFDPAITILALLASLIAIFTDRWINSKERRKELLRVLAHELYMNIGVFNDLNAAKKDENLTKAHVYPRFYTTSLTTVISSGMFTGPKDKKLWKSMNGWLQKSSDYNNRLNISETQVFSNPKNANAFNKKITEGKAAIEAISEFKKLVDIVMTNYEIETEIDYDTVLFEEK